jgi:hypothetical protein
MSNPDVAGTINGFERRLDKAKIQAAFGGN